MNEVHTISDNVSELKNCPVLITVTDPEDHRDYEVCGSELKPKLHFSIVGDDYGEWPYYHIEFDCGHTFTQMEESLKYGEFL